MCHIWVKSQKFHIPSSGQEEPQNLRIVNNTFFHEQLFKIFSQSGKAYFDLQPSWFDTLSNTGGCLEIENFPVTARDLEAMKNVKSNSKSSTKAAQGMKKETFITQFRDFNSSSFIVLKLDAMTRNQKQVSSSNYRGTEPLWELGRVLASSNSERNSLIS